MSIVARVGVAMQELFRNCAQAAAETSGIIRRKRKFTAETLAQTFVLGLLYKPDASEEDLARMAVQCGVEVTPQAISQRYTLRMVSFMEELFRKATKVVFGSDRSLAPILERFSSVVLLDSSTITLPESMEQQFAGCGGSHDQGKAAMKLQTELDLRSGSIRHIQIEPGRSPDAATSRQHVNPESGSLRIADLGYFNVAVFRDMEGGGGYFLSRLQFGTAVHLPHGDSVQLLDWLQKQPGPMVDQPILLGKAQKLPCRLIAWRLPTAVANQRRAKLRRESLSKRGREPSAERLAWCDWTILVTNVPPGMLTPAEAAVLYRSRWQVELLFKRWKSQGLVATLTGSTDEQQMVRIWARLLAALVQHWLIIGTAWGDATKSLSKICEAIRPFVSRIAASLFQDNELTRTLKDLRNVISKTCRRNKRRKPGTFELLNNVDLLDLCLT